ncbi:MAG: hypothetical protein M0D57_08440 [Sphingobacteriales bacterium JAD_PAG50586_3]|nr:MAG: hypothetical protein M0D57_08440 [Sphingobacteriales bacterium JAD_PAG50586_3]
MPGQGELLTNSPRYLTWTMLYENCNGETRFQQYSLAIDISQKTDPTSTSNRLDTYTELTLVNDEDTRFSAKSIINQFDSIAISKYPKVKGGVAEPEFSTDPLYIKGKSHVYMNEPLNLTVNGGRLGRGAQWVWYSGSCGNGKVIYRSRDRTMPKPLQNSGTIYVRAEGDNNISNCAQINIDVDKSSKPPTGINGNTKLCKGEKATLTVVGGILGENAQWVWYEGDCNGDNIGTGTFINIKPTKATTYFVRAEGLINNTQCAKIEITVNEKSIMPTSITSNYNGPVCEGNNVVLRLNGGNLVGDANWIWYQNYCGGSSIGSGTSLAVSPKNSVTYYVRPEGSCISEDCLSYTLNIIGNSIKPYDINTSAGYIVDKRSKTSLSVKGGNLAKGAQWKWYKGGCDPAGHSIGSGSSINVKVRKNTAYSVRAEGSCGVSESTCITIATRNTHVFSAGRYNEKQNKFLHLGIGGGFDYYAQSAYGQNDFLPNDSSYLALTGIAYRVEAIFRPIMKEGFTFGLFGSYSFGTKESYRNLNYGAEMAVGSNPVKLLIQSNNSIVTLSNIKRTQGVYNYSFQNTIARQSFSAGIRLGRYKSVKSRPHSIDIVANVSRQLLNGDISHLTSGYNTLPKWNYGIGASYWLHSLLKIQGTFIFEKAKKQILTLIHSIICLLFII